MATVSNSNLVTDDASFAEFDIPANLGALPYDSTVQYCFVADFDVGEDHGVGDLHVSAYFNVFS
jgi:hypothetical protein